MLAVDRECGRCELVVYPLEFFDYHMSDIPLLRLREFAIEHPSAEVVGVDLSPVQPTLLPANCHFEIDDINLEWTWPDEYFNYIHVRMLSGSVPDWVEFYQKAFRHLTPGGWVEQIEIGTVARSDDGTVTPDLPYGLWAQIFEDLSRMS